MTRKLAGDVHIKETIWSARRAVLAVAVTLMAACGVNDAAQAQLRTARESGETHSGKVVRAGNGQLVMANAEQHTHRITDETQITRNGRRVQLEDLEPGDRIEVTTQADDFRVAVRIVARPEDEYEERAYRPSGERVRERTIERADDLGMRVEEDEQDGLRVRTVQRGTPAQEAGLREGDRILEVDGEKVQSQQALNRALRQAEDRQIRIRLERDGERRTLTLRLEDERERIGLRPREDMRLPRAPTREQRPWLGIMVDDVDREVRVQQVLPGGPAERAGIERGDVITSVDGESVRNVDAFIRELDRLDVGDRARLTIERDGERETLTVRLGDREEFLRRFSPRLPRFAPERDPRAMIQRREYDYEPEDDLEELVLQVLEELQELRREVRQLWRDGAEGRER